MEEYKKELVDFMLKTRALKFGSFTLKSGRQSPFFMNAGAFVTGSQLKKLGEFYAHAIQDTYGLDFDVLFGPAYKGIPLGVATAMALYDLYGKEVRYCSNRKEIKDHGSDKGSFLGSPLQTGDRVLIIEDVTTSGKSIEETHPLLQSVEGLSIKGMIVLLNRMEKGKNETGAFTEIEASYGFPVHAIISMSEIITYLREKTKQGAAALTDELLESLWTYYQHYGAREYREALEAILHRSPA